jgi:hypothetical protein
MRVHLSPLLTIPLALFLFGLAGCDQASLDPGTPTALSAPGADAIPAGHGNLLKAVRQATSRFNSTTQAVRAGYDADDHCVSHPDLGGMGYHWVNGALIDPVFDPLQPEALLYEPGNGNNPRLVGVEYIVIDVGQDHPHFDGHPFDVGGIPRLMEAGVAHWSLHVWAHKSNPSGLFFPFNPSVSCS